MPDIDKILLDNKVYELYKQVAEGKIDEKVFIKHISDMVSNLLVIVPEFNREEVANLCKGIANDLLNGDNFNIDALIKNANKITNSLKNAKKHSKKLMSISEQLQYGLIAERELEYLGFNHYCMLNRIIYSCFMVVGGISNSGKTSFCTDLVVDYIDRKGKDYNDVALLFYTLDDSKDAIFRKINKQANGRIKNIGVSWVKNNVYLEDYLSWDTIYLVRQKIMELKKKYKKVIFICDYLQLVRLPMSAWTNKKDYIDNIVYELKSLTIEYNLWTMLISQFNRSGTGKYRYSQSSEIENQAEICIDLEKSNDSKHYIDFKKAKENESGQYYETTIDGNYNFGELKVVSRLKNKKFF